jgi:hypothetical protein
MEMCFLQNKKYYPYDKWFGTAFNRIPESEKLKPLLWSALEKQDTETQLTCLHQLITMLGIKHNELNIGKPVELHYGNFEVGINNAVRPYKVFNSGNFKKSCLNNMEDEIKIWFDKMVHEWNTKSKEILD